RAPDGDDASGELRGARSSAAEARARRSALPDRPGRGGRAFRRRRPRPAGMAGGRVLDPGADRLTRSGVEERAVRTGLVPAVGEDLEGSIGQLDVPHAAGAAAPAKRCAGEDRTDRKAIQPRRGAPALRAGSTLESVLADPRWSRPPDDVSAVDRSR